MPARFQYYRHQKGWYWRLLGANNRTIAVGPDPFAERTAAVRDSLEVCVLAMRAGFELSEEGHTWSWSMVDRGHPRAGSPNRYGRRIDCERAVRQFRDAAREALRAAREASQTRAPTPVDGGLATTTVPDTSVS